MQTEQPTYREAPDDLHGSLVLSGPLLASYLELAGPRARAELGKWGATSEAPAQQTGC